jgi:hypothetical protein
MADPDSRAYIEANSDNLPTAKYGQRCHHVKLEQAEELRQLYQQLAKLRQRLAQADNDEYCDG